MRNVYALRGGIVFTSFLLGGVLRADTTPLFAWIANVPKHDVLNVRALPDYRAAKVAAIASDAPYSLKVYRCKKVSKRSRWCLVSPAELYGVGVPDFKGWVNARYLTFFDNGYVLVDGKGGCDYALQCAKGMCELVDEIVRVGGVYLLRSTRKVARKRLSPSNRFEAMDEEGDGYCTLDTYLSSASQPKGAVALFFDALRRGDTEAAAAQIHPKEGLLLSDHIVFGVQDVHFMPDAFQSAWKRNAKRIPPYAEEGDDAALAPRGLRDFFAQFPPLEEAEVLRERSDFAGYANRTKGIKAVELGWNVHTGTPRQKVYAVAIVERYGTRWYLVALLRKRWTI